MDRSAGLSNDLLYDHVGVDREGVDPADGPAHDLPARTLRRPACRQEWQPAPPNGTHYYYTVVVYPNNARTTLSLGTSPGSPRTILNPVGNRTIVCLCVCGFNANSLGLPEPLTDGRGHMTTICYQPVGSGTTAIFPTGIQSPVAQYQYKYNSNNQLAAVVDELGNRSTLVWDSIGNRIAVIDPYNQADQLCLRFDGAAGRGAKRAGPAGDAGLRQPGPAGRRHQSAGLSNIVCVRRQQPAPARAGPAWDTSRRRCMTA